MLESYLARGLKVGLVAGLLFGVFVALVMNPVIALSGEMVGDHAADGHAHGEEGHSHGGDEHAHDGGSGLGSLDTASISVVAGVFWGLLLGVVAFGFVFYFLEPAIPGRGDTKSFVLGAAGFVTVSGAPWLVLPPQPSGATQPLPGESRALWYGAMMLAGALACGLAGYAYTRLRERGRVPAVGVAAVPLLALVAIPFFVTAQSVDQALPEAMVTAYRALVALGQVTLWLLLATTHAWFRRREHDEPTTADAYDGPISAD